MTAGPGSRRRRRSERGFAAIELVGGTALLVLPVVCLVLALPGWADRQTVARLAARDATRRVALATVCDVGAARAAVRDAAVAGGLAPDAVALSLDCAPGAVLARGAPVTARVTVAVPALVVPALGTVGAWHWTAGQTLVVDPFAAEP